MEVAFWITSNKKIGVGEATSNPGKEPKMSNKSYFDLKDLGLAFEYLSTMYDTTTAEFFQEIERNIAEELQALVDEEFQRWYSEHRIVKTEEGGQAINYRSGARQVKIWIPLFLEVPILLPKLRLEQFHSDILNSLFQKTDSFIVALIYALYISGISYRKISDILLFLRYKISPSGVSKKLRQLKDSLEEYWDRKLNQKEYRYLVVDGLWIKEKRSIKGKHVVLTAVGITEEGEREIIGKKVCTNEGSACWEELFNELEDRGLDMDKIKLIVADKGKGLRSFITSRYKNKPIVRCGFHFGGNVLKKVTDPWSKREMFSDLFWILGPKDVPPDTLRKWKAFRWKTEVVYEKWMNLGYIKEAEKLKEEIDEVLVAYKHEKDIFKASKLITSNTIERYFRDYRQFSYGKGVLFDEDSIAYLTNLVFYDINQRLKMRPPLWQLKNFANKS